MKRTEFIKSLGLSSGGLLLPKKLLDKKSVKIYDNYVRGLKQYQFSVVEKQLKKDDILDLHRDTKNIHDSFAVSVYFKEYKLGYLPAYENIVIANMLDAGVEIAATVSFLREEKNPYKTDSLGISLFANLITPTSQFIKEMSQKRADDVEDIYRKGYNL